METENKTIFERLAEIQSRLKVPKDKRNGFGNYNYRSAEQILTELTPLLKEQKCALLMADEIVMIGDRHYVRATATLTGPSGDSVSASALAREQEDKKGMDQAQVTGSASSYARKYALGGLFCIDDGKDPDSMDNSGEGEGKPARQKTANPLSPATQAKGKPLIQEGNDLWNKALAFCRKKGMGASGLRQWCEISDADVKTMDGILEFSGELNEDNKQTKHDQK